MEIIREEQDEISILKPLGRLDSNTSAKFEEELSGVISHGPRNLVVDFEGLDYISSAGLRVLLKAAKEIKRGEGKIVICSMNDYIKEVFEIAGFVSIFPIFPTRDSALEEL